MGCKCTSELSTGRNGQHHLISLGPEERKRTSQGHPEEDASELIIVARLNDPYKLIQDYVIVPKSDSAKPYLTLSDASLAHHRAVRVDTVDEVITEIKARFTSPSHAAPAKPTRRNKQTKPGRPKTRNVRARH